MEVCEETAPLFCFLGGINSPNHGITKLELQKKYSAWVSHAPSCSFLQSIGSTEGQLNECYVNKQKFSLYDSDADRPSVAVVHSVASPDS